MVILPPLVLPDLGDDNITLLERRTLKNVNSYLNTNI
jgi:hypothetical protein